MIIESSTDLRNDYGDIERHEELHRLRAKLEAAEQGRLAGAPTYTIEESWEQLEKIFSEG